MTKYYTTIVSLFFLLILSFYSCNKDPKNRSLSSLEEIRQKGKIVAVTQNNSTDYFIYRGEPMGYQLELLQLLADHLKIKLEVIVSNDLENSFKQIENGTIDLMAINLTINKPRSEKVRFTKPIGQTRQVLVQRKPSNYKDLPADRLEKLLLRNQVELGGKVIYVQKHSAYVHRLKNLSEEIGQDIIIVEVADYEDEQLIKMVAEGSIDFTVCDEEVAMVSQMYYDNIDASTAISFPQNLAWAVNKDSKQLLEVINNWIDSFKGSPEHLAIYKKYFKNEKKVKMVNSDYFANLSGKVSRFDDIIKEKSKNINWDWRLVASLICQESRFDPSARSWAGAFGIMQFMPSTAINYGISEESSPERQIEAGVKYLKWLEERIRQENIKEEEVIYFVLAAYNAGLGHVLDARRLAGKYGFNPDRWEDVSYFILNKSNPKYYLDPDVKHGYCRGEETCAYVEQILDRFNHYKNIIDGN